MKTLVASAEPERRPAGPQFSVDMAFTTGATMLIWTTITDYIVAGPREPYRTTAYVGEPTPEIEP